MSRILEWLLDLRDIRLDRDAPLLLKWNTQLEPWMLLGLTLFVIAWVGAWHRREQTTPGRRFVLATLRCLLLALVAIALCQPSLVLQRNRVEPSYVAVLVDRSMSMAAVDAFHDAERVKALARGAGLDRDEEVFDLSRFELARRMLTRDQSAPLRRLLEKNGLELAVFDASLRGLGFARDAEALPSLAAGLADITPDGVITDLARAIEETIRRAKGRRLAAIVLVSDGSHTAASSLNDALERAADRRIPVYPVRIGSTDPRFDIEVGPLRAESTVFAHDILIVEALVTGRGLKRSTPVRMRLIDESDESVAATEEITVHPGAAFETVELRTQPARTGRISYRVEADPLEGETTTQNNVDRIVVTVIDERVKVLYVEGYPRYEYRYLKNALLREPTVEASVLLLEADEQFVQEGADPIRRFPATPDELDRYDVVLFGDVDPRGDWLSQAQQEMLVEFVARKGGGFGLIAGERAAPRYFQETPLERLIPIRIDPTFRGKYDAPLTAGYVPVLTPSGRTNRLFRFVIDREENERLFTSLPELYWIARTLGPKPGATVLAEHPSMRSAYGPMPVVVVGRYGGGKLFFQATDDTWRWRRLTGETLHDAYWVHVVRSLMRTDRVARDRSYTIATDRRSYDYWASVRVQVELLDPALLAEPREEVTVLLLALTDHGGAAHDDAARSVRRPSAPSTTVRDIVRRVSAHRISAQSGLFEATVTPAHPGMYAAEVGDVPEDPARVKPSAAFRVRPPDLEARRPEADHETLERIAASTQARVIEPDALESALSGIRDRSVKIPDDIIEPLWDSRLIFGLFVLMISMEWVLRKVYGLV